MTALLLLTVDCGSDVIAESSVSEPDHRDPAVSSGAAEMGLECSGEVYSGSTGRNWGVTSGHDDPADALESFIEDEEATLPDQGHRTERDTQDRVLFSHDVEGDTKVAVIVADGMTDATGESGLSMETYAQCDPAELPPEVTDQLGIQVWVNQQGERVPTTVLRSSQGPEHCDWERATFLDLKGDTFIRDPDGVLPPEWFSVTFDPDVTLPDGTNDTVYRLDRQALWVTPDRSAVDIATGNDVERWPAAGDFEGCG